MSVFTGVGVRPPPPIVQEIFAASILCGVSSGQRLQQNSAWMLLRQHSAGCNFQFQQWQVCKRLATADHPRKTARYNVQVWTRLLQIAANVLQWRRIDYSFAASNATASIVLRQTTCSGRKVDELCTVVEIAEVVLSIDMIISVAAFCPLSCIHILIFCFTLQSKSLK